jgi:hypothetical protein
MQVNSLLAELKAILPPPEEPYKAEDDWACIEFALQTALPADFKAFIAAYGSGYVHDLGFKSDPPTGTSCDPYVLNPFDYLGGNDFFRRVGSTIKYVGAMHHDYPRTYPYPPWPHKGGLLNWCTTGNGDAFYWRTEGTPDNWPIVAWHDASAKFIDYPCAGAVDFLVKLFSNVVAGNRNFFGPFVRPVFQPRQRSGPARER